VLESPGTRRTSESVFAEDMRADFPTRGGEGGVSIVAW
jgi:hypothetical protein